MVVSCIKIPFQKLKMGQFCVKVPNCPLLFNDANTSAVLRCRRLCIILPNRALTVFLTVVRFADVFDLAAVTVHDLIWTKVTLILIAVTAFVHEMWTSCHVVHLLYKGYA